MLKIVLLGSPQIAIETFEEIIKNFQVVAIVTQPDSMQGRGMTICETPVAILGKKYQIPVFKPNKIIDIKNDLINLKPDLLLTFAYGQILPEEILKIGNYRPVNIHGSLLPKYRGAAPIQYAILNNDNEIGISLIEMVKQMDAGDIYFQAKIEINNKTNSLEAFDIISKLAKNNISKWLEKIKNNDINPQKQGDNFSLSPKIPKSMCELNNKMNLFQTTRIILACNPPGSYIFYENKRMKIFDFSYENIKNSIPLDFNDGTLYVTEYQFEGKKRQKIN